MAVLGNKILQEPVPGKAGYFFQRPRLFEKVAGPRNEHQQLFTWQGIEGMLIERYHLVVLAPDYEESGRPDPRQRLGCQVGASSPRYNRPHNLRELCRREESCGSSGAGPKVANVQGFQSVIPFEPSGDCHQSLGKERYVEA